MHGIFCAQHILLARIISVFFFPEELEVSIYGRMIQHWCNILTGNMVQVSGGLFELSWLFPNCNPAEVSLRLSLGAHVLTWFGELKRGHLWRCLNSGIALQAVLQWQQPKIYLHRHQAILFFRWNKMILDLSILTFTFLQCTDPCFESTLKGVAQATGHPTGKGHSTFGR